MTRFIIFVALLAVQFTRGISEKEIKAEYGLSQALYTEKQSTNALKCKLVTSTGEEYEYKPDSGDITDNIRTLYSYSRFDVCDIRIDRVTFENAGHWEITAFVKDKDTDKIKEEVFKFTLYITAEGDVSPSDIVVHEGHYANAKLNHHFENLTKCVITSPKGQVFDILTSSIDDISLFGECGFRLYANESHKGTWLMKAIINDFSLWHGTVELLVEKRKEKESYGDVIYMKLGSAHTISYRDDITNCEMTDPHGVVLPLQVDECVYRIPVVTSYHDGIWRLRYGTFGRILPLTRTFRVITYDEKLLNSSISFDENQMKLLCRFALPRGKYVHFCRFIRPDGAILNMFPGVGHDRYTSFGDPLPVRRYVYNGVECGIIVQDPAPVDYGAWKCEIGSGYDGEYTGSIIIANRLNGMSTIVETRKLPVYQDNIFIKQGDSFKITCSIDQVLKYCWIRSPNGTAYSVVNHDSKSPFTLHYTGNGLSLGECGATIRKATETDNGKWECHMGTENRTEEKASTSVVVTDSYLIPVTASAETDGRSNLICKILPGTIDKTINYCRWIRPDGEGIYNGISSRYITTFDDQQCELIIQNHNFEKDIGRWTCVAGLRGATMDEQFAHIDVGAKAFRLGTLVGVTIGACILLMIMAGILLLINIRKRQQILLPKNPPAYTEESAYLPPKPFQTQHRSKEFQY